ncbi:PEP-CTERM sorting domain-containing protein [Rubinisphaera brasiliensis]|uniref:PEP motif putative anchor domain protein n=1 Tax=Rubinisphaera brasiliensis (strain ATCC 49424 / DSM 5305 / JCM 21570 / IAM 15109 / NBRC 103401 / IFAM 1448) TaxID=756272 RepID=F0SGZ0_RUBBR|nr:PEP-CTERM sorting domain-containing protein [Rubinisphaera brasiliensis]ADY59475.1 PEP motif putative anchor domain protein [Rubinisphaera brasiliensis DSM 5305]
MIRKGQLAVMGLAVLVAMAGQAQAGVITFDSSNPGTWGPISAIGGGMRWSGTGGGHLYNNYWDGDDIILFAAPTTVNSWEMTNRPWAGYAGGDYGKIDIEMFDTSNNSLWFQTVDLTNYDWFNPLQVNANVNNVSRMTFYAPGDAPHYNGFWPSVDNIVYTEPFSSSAAVPEPTSLALFGISACVAGVGAARRRRGEKKAETAA